MYPNNPTHYLPPVGDPCYIYPIPFMPRQVMLANAYIPYQSFVDAYSLSEALMKGTLFPELFQPYVPEDKHWKGER
ncbi:hypothetical protein Amet_3655 [Alkaliphilus metalliredigens QYMF]|uniref:Spore coat associated protein CotJA n=1 Tax=Alkaliphilus metalliredigens (strain QYMF) TaxID=293826 RepID=A6TUA9_ALKMQ|nr:spore coat associated protein CotJA [Alkaliphilus metalliredigens]ABR49777.1 hypothetical protein Amet_3655 [Alkaliphilus metalliredigens QYMF]